MKFLCDHHRQQVLEEPAKALSYWRNWMSRGNALIDEQQWKNACGFIGCSFEVAEWLLGQPAHDADEGQRAVERYMVAGHQLAECLGRTGHPDLELHYLLTVHLQLLERIKQRCAHFWLLRQPLQISRAMLSRYRNQHGSFKGYYDCCMETELAIKQCLN